MGGNYQKDMFRQLAELMERVDTLETACKVGRQEIKWLSAENNRLQKENESLREEINVLKEKCDTLTVENEQLKKENALLRDDNERMKRILGNNSSNSSLPPSTDKDGKGGSNGTPRSANTYNGRKKGDRKPGGQAGHKGSCLSRSEIEKGIKEGAFEHRVEEVGNPAARPGMTYITRYRLDLKFQPVVTEFRIYAGEDGKYHVPENLNTEIAYGDTLKGFCAYLYSEGVMSVERIAECISSITGGVLSLSTGSVYSFIDAFSKGCAVEEAKIEEDLMNGHVTCTDGTTVSLNGKKTNIRNFSNENSVLYYHTGKKSVAALQKIPFLRKYTGILSHDHETALFHFGTGHAECNVHIGRYLEKNTEETGNSWSRDMYSFLTGMNDMRNGLIAAGATGVDGEKLLIYHARYDAILCKAEIQNAQTKGKLAKSEENRLIRRLRKYKKNHLLFLIDFQVPFSNNMSERDLRKCKNRQKMSGGFRTPEGVKMYCSIMSVVETAKRRGLNILETIASVIDGRRVFG